MQKSIQIKFFYLRSSQIQSLIFPIYSVSLCVIYETCEWFQPQAYEVIPAVTVISLWALSFTYPVSPSWKTIFCDKAINRYSSDAFLANCFNSLFIQRDSLRCLRRIKAEVHRTMSVRNEITKGIRFNDVHCTGKISDFCVHCKSNHPSIPYSRRTTTAVEAMPYGKSTNQ